MRRLAAFAGGLVLVFDGLLIVGVLLATAGFRVPLLAGLVLRAAAGALPESS